MYMSVHLKGNCMTENDVIDNINNSDKNAANKNNNSAKKHRGKRSNKLISKPIIITSCLIIFIVLVILATFLVRRPSSISGLFSGDFKNSSVNSLKMYSAKSTAEITGKNDTTTFKDGDPIIVVINFKKASDFNTTLNYKVEDSKGKLVRNGTLPITNTDTDKDYSILLVTMPTNALGEGKYKFTAQNQDNKLITQQSFTVTK